MGGKTKPVTYSRRELNLKLLEYEARSLITRPSCLFMGIISHDVGVRNITICKE